ncbi:unnamed protein product, partial [Tilletia controversa]
SAPSGASKIVLGGIGA